MAQHALWFHVLSVLQQDIQNGRYAIGSRIPTESELSHQFSCSRHTVRTALQELTRLGWISRRPRIGSVVMHQGDRPRHRIEFNDPKEFTPATPGGIVRYASCSLITASRLLADRLSVPDGDAFFCFYFIACAVNSSGTWPITGRMKYYVPVNSQYESTGDRISRFLEKNQNNSVMLPETILAEQLQIPISQTDFQIFSESPNEEELQELEEKNSSVLCVTRRFLDASGALLMACLGRHYGPSAIAFSAQRVG